MWEDNFDRELVLQMEWEAKWRRRLVLLLWCAVIFGGFFAWFAHAEEPEPLRITVYPEVVAWSRSAQVRVTVFVLRDERNTDLYVSWWYSFPCGGSSFSRQLDGGSRVSYTRYMKEFCTGYIFIKATLCRGKECVSRTKEVEVH